MIETAVRKVAPHDEEKTINLMSHFAWKLTHTQEVNTSNSRLENRGDDLYCVTEKENYVKLTFERDTNTPHYDRLVKLEKDYLTPPSAKPDLPVSKIVLSVICIIVFWPVGIYLSYKTYKEISGRNKAWEESFESKKAAIIKEAASLIAAAQSL